MAVILICSQWHREAWKIWSEDEEEDQSSHLPGSRKLPQFPAKRSQLYPSWGRLQVPKWMCLLSHFVTLKPRIFWDTLCPSSAIICNVTQFQHMWDNQLRSIYALSHSISIPSRVSPISTPPPCVFLRVFRFQFRRTSFLWEGGKIYFKVTPFDVALSVMRNEIKIVTQMLTV